MTIGAAPFSTPSLSAIGWAGWAVFCSHGILKMAVSTRRILALWLPRLSTDRLIRKRGAPFDAPLVIGQKANNALYVHALDARAQKAWTP